MKSTYFILTIAVVTVHFSFIMYRLDHMPAVECSSHTHMKVEKTLPEKCHPFYNDGTGRWAECMGVGPK